MSVFTFAYLFGHIPFFGHQWSKSMRIFLIIFLPKQTLRLSGSKGGRGYSPTKMSGRVLSNGIRIEHRTRPRYSPSNYRTSGLGSDFSQDTKHFLWKEQVEDQSQWCRVSRTLPLLYPFVHIEFTCTSHLFPGMRRSKQAPDRSDFRPAAEISDVPLRFMVPISRQTALNKGDRSKSSQIKKSSLLSFFVIVLSFKDRRGKG